MKVEAKNFAGPNKFSVITRILVVLPVCVVTVGVLEAFFASFSVILEFEE